MIRSMSHRMLIPFFQEFKSLFFPYVSRLVEREEDGYFEINPVQTVHQPIELNALDQNRPWQRWSTPYGEIDYISTGRENDKTLVLVPGVPDQIYSFHRLIPTLAKEYHVVAISPPGKGYSTYSPRFDFSLRAYGEFWRYILQEMKLGSVTFVAHSCGVAEVIQSIMDEDEFQDRVDGIISICGWFPSVLAEPLPFSILDRLLGSEEGPGVYRKFKDNKYFGIQAQVDRSFHRSPAELGISYISEQYSKSWPRFQDDQNHQEQNYRLEGLCRMVREQNRISRNIAKYHSEFQTKLDRLSQIPFLVLGASHDKVVHGPKDQRGFFRNGSFNRYTDSQGKTYAERVFEKLLAISKEKSVLHRQHIISNSGHMVHLERPEMVCEQIFRFVG